MMKTLLCVWSALVLFAAPIAAQNIVGGTIESWPPFMYKVDGEMTGLATDVVKATFEKAGVDLDIRVYPWARAYKTALVQKNAMVFMLYRTSDREELFKWVGPIVPSYDMFFYKLKSRTDITVNSLEDAKKYTVGVIRNVANHKYLLSQGFEEGKNIELVAEPNQNIKKLFIKRIDLLINNEYTMPLLLKELGYSYADVETVFSVLEADAGYMGFNKDTPDALIGKIETAFQEIEAAGDIKAIQGKYLNMYQ